MGGCSSCGKSWPPLNPTCDVCAKKVYNRLLAQDAKLAKKRAALQLNLQRYAQHFQPAATQTQSIVVSPTQTSRQTYRP